jgi:PAS domain-containing protein
MKPQLRFVGPGTPGPRGATGIAAGVLRLVKSAPEREAIAAGQVDAVIDPASGEVILLPDAQQALHQRQARIASLLALAADWVWEQDENYCFVSHASTAPGDPTPRPENMLGKPLWELGFRTTAGFDWDTHRQQLDWRATFRDLELEWTDGADEVRWVRLDGEPIFDAQDEFKGYHGIMRDVTRRKWLQALAH